MLSATIPTIGTPAIALRFDVILEAHNTLKDPVKRAQYDIQHKSQWGFRWKLAAEANDSNGIERDVDVQNRLLSIFMQNADKTSETPASAISNLNAC